MHCSKSIVVPLKNTLVRMLDKIKKESQGVAVVNLLRPAGTLYLVKYSAKITRFYLLSVAPSNIA